MLLRDMAAHTSERQRAARERLATNLKLLRGKLSMSQENLADRAGIHRTQLSQIERGVASANLDSIVAFAEALDVDVALLLTEPSEKPVPLKSGRKKAEAQPSSTKPQRSSPT